MSSLNLNKAVLAGRLTADPELKTTANGTSVCGFVIAVNRRYKTADGQQEADFITCTAWRQTAEFIAKYFSKGSAICITGTIQTRSWEDKDGNTRRATDVVAEEAYFVDSKAESERSDRPAGLPSQFTGEQLDRAMQGEKKSFADVQNPPRPATFEDVEGEGLPF